jgi:hypothetical protein
LRERSRTVTGLQRIVQKSLKSDILCEVLRQTDIADNSRQKIVEIVRNAARELAQTFHLLTLAKLLLS